MNLFILYFKSLKSGALHVNAVPFLCPMALNLHQKRPSPVTSGWLFHRAIRRETAALSSVLMGDGAAKLPPLSVIPPCNTTRNRSTIIRFDGDGARKLPPLGVILSLIPRTLSLHLAIVLPGAAVGFVLRLHAL